MSEAKQYLDDELKLFAAVDYESLMKLLMQDYSEKRAFKLFKKWYDEIDRREEGHITNDKGIYTLMNEEYKSSLALIGGTNYNRYLAQGEWIENHKELFGKRILDVGCLNGILTCFIAKLFPESNVIGIDDNKPAIVNAKKLAKELNLKNVKFVFVPLLRYEGSFDTVFSSLVLHENYDTRCPDDYETKTEEEMIDYWYKLINPTIEKISSLLENKGGAICFERYHYSIALAALLKAFSQNDLQLDINQFDYARFANEPGMVSYILRKESGIHADFRAQYETIKTKLSEKGVL